MIAENGVMDAGIFEYGNQWVRDTSFTLLGLVHAGQFELARGGFEHILKDMLRDDGGAMVDSKLRQPRPRGARPDGRAGACPEDLPRLDRRRFAAAASTGSKLRGDDRAAAAARSSATRPAWSTTAASSGSGRSTTATNWRIRRIVVLGLRDAADLAEPLGAPGPRRGWRAEADRMLQAMLSHPTRALVDDGRLIKRRGTDGRHVKEVPGGGEADSPGKTEQIHLAEPDTTDGPADRAGAGRSRARRWPAKRSTTWKGCGTPAGPAAATSATIRSGQGDQPGPWPMPSCFVMRAQHEAGLLDRSRRTLDWLHGVQGGRAGRLVRGNSVDPLDGVHLRASSRGPPATSASSSCVTCWASASRATGWC